MAIPTYDDLFTPTLKALQELGGRAHVRDIEEKVAEILNLSAKERAEIHRGTRTKLSYRLAWARYYLKRYGLVNKVKYGQWGLSQQGKETSDIDKNDVKSFVQQNTMTVTNEQIEQNTDWYEDFSIEKEEEDGSSANDISNPFDPKEIRVTIEPKTIDHLISRMQHDEIDLNTEFQRNGNLWKPEMQCRLIESILLRLPLPPFYFDASDDNKWLVVDGLQRLWSLKNFVLNAIVDKPDTPPMVLNGLDILTDYNNNNITYSRLSRSMQRRILETPITTYLIQPGTPKVVKYNIFSRINSGGLNLNAMEIRNALNQGKPAEFLKNLSEDSDLREVLPIRDKRMEDRELILRAVAFINKDYIEYSSPMNNFLNEAMGQLAVKNETQLAEIHSGIVDVTYLYADIFEKDMFSRSFAVKEYKPQINSALFEALVSETYRLSESERNLIVTHQADFKERYKAMLLDKEFTNAITTSTASRTAVRTRFEKTRELLNSFLHDYKSRSKEL